MRKQKLPEWAQWETVLEGFEKMLPVIKATKAELLAGQKAKRAGNSKRVAYHMRRIVNLLFNCHSYFWHPMFEWAQMEEFQYRMKAVKKARKRHA